MEHTKYTPEPWKIGKYEWRKKGQAYQRTAILNSEGDDYVTTNICGAEANAQRIVSCVNACAGISNEALEDGVVGQMLAALKEMVQWDKKRNSPEGTTHKKIIDEFMYVIANAEGKELVYKDNKVEDKS